MTADGPPLLRLHWSPDSANLVVRVALERLGLGYEGVRIDRARQGQRDPAYLKLNPQGLIPVLEDGPLVLFETGAILAHLADKTGKLGPGGPQAHDPVARAAFLKWLFYLSNTVHADLRLGFYAGRYVPAEMVPKLREGVRRRLSGHLALLEAELTAGSLTGGPPGMLEDYLALCLRWAQLYPSQDAPLLEGLAPWPAITALARRAEADGGFRRAAAAEAIRGPHPVTQPAPPDVPRAEVSG